ncbi:MAG: cytochrome c maturation protein CcmE [Candidatus Paracaedimonas acanthamoebae]|uniref:Cytochrome c-type biogenesis protein CcmE n=1 Tax=Candidatus Paracaedimonas acanthamoebae TaxID=244581 RepID=A0A8J7PRW1_9PROT|nr:cytochrome c maturation protein CcmE [Candidatus Paracaedimonas acanthamoebae]
MISKKKQRLYYIMFALISLGGGLSAVLYNLRTHLIFFYTPEDLNKGNSLPSEKIRLGGVVKEKSLKYAPIGIAGEFILTDFKKEILVTFSSALPDLFREGQGVVAEGKFKENGVFDANRILAKHDENYRPPKPGNKQDKIVQTLKD